MRIANHRLLGDDGRQVPFDPTNNKSIGIDQRFLVIHYTGGGSAGGTISWLKSRDAQASAHLVIGRDGSITQMVPFDRKSWHAGRSRWNDLTGMNAYSIGIELCNWGQLRGAPGGWRTRTGRPMDDTLVDQLEHKHGGGIQGWEIYPEEQIDAVVRAATAIVRKYEMEDIVGHEDIAPGRKVDPGPAFPMDYLKAKLSGRSNDDEPAPFVMLADTNHRRWPSFLDNVIQVIPKGTPVTIIRSGAFINDGSSNTWHLVEHQEPQGWVFGTLVGGA
jgi:N-acetylmuramoyl-L-alanine amidase